MRGKGGEVAFCPPHMVQLLEQAVQRAADGADLARGGGVGGRVRGAHAEVWRRRGGRIRARGRGGSRGRRHPAIVGVARRGAGSPWDARFIGLLRLKDWLQLLSFDLNGGRFGCYAPPFASAKWLRRFDFMEKAGARWWPIMGGAYVVRAVKRVHGLRIVTPAWRRERARRRGLAPVPQRNRHAMRENGKASSDG